MDFAEDHIGFPSKKNTVKQITHGKSKRHVSFNELSTSKPAGCF